MTIDYWWMLAAACLFALDLRYSGKGLWVIAIACSSMALLLYAGLALPICGQILLSGAICTSLLVARLWVRTRQQQIERESALGEGIVLTVTGDGRATVLFEDQELPCVSLKGGLRIGQRVLIQGFGSDAVYCRALEP